MNNIYEQLTAKLQGLFYGYGLDFGTYRSMMAVNDSGKSDPSSIQSAPLEGELQNGIPSLFWYTKGGQEYCCDQVIANNGLLDDPSGVCTSIKMKLDQNAINLNGKSFTPSYIAETEIRQIINLSHAAFEKNFIDHKYNKLVVGVPVRFGAAQKNQLLNILKASTDGKNIVLLPEPIAAAICYSHFTKWKPNKVLVYDLGAGTFDTVLLVPNKHRTKESPYPYRSLYPDGLTIAGDIFDKKIAGLILTKLARSNSHLDLNILSNSNTADNHRLLILSRDIKEKLSTRESVKNFVEGIDTTGHSCVETITISRKEFEDCIRPEIEKTIRCVKKVLNQAGENTNPDLDILLVGGSTYIPLVRSMIEEAVPHLGKKHVLQKFPEQAIAMGCSIYANSEIADAPIAFAYAVGRYYDAEKRNVLDVTIPSNIKLPYSTEANYYTKNKKQKELTIMIFEVEHGQKNDYLNVDEGNPTPFSIIHNFKKEVKEGTEVHITFELSENGILSITFDDHGITPIDRQQITISNICQED